MAKPAKVWLVDDDPELREMLRIYLVNEGYEVRCLETAEQCTALLTVQRPDILILDLMLPGEDGLSLLRRLRDQKDTLAVLMLTAKGDPVDRIIGLEQGADDYLAKPFLPRELAARLAAVLRRREVPHESLILACEEPICFGDFVLNVAQRTLCRGACDLGITSGEFSLLLAFAHNPHRPLSRERLIEISRGPACETDLRSMDVQVSRLRKLIEKDPRRPCFLQTVWGYGYVFVPDGQVSGQ
jgi:two-component system phosphate regulon response regulator OmpR